MTRTRVIVAVVFALGAIAVSSMVATGAARRNAPSASTHRALGGANVKYARIAAVVDQGGAVIRSKGISGVTHPDVGIYCVAVKDTSLKVRQFVPMVTVEWGNSSGDDLMANYYADGADCPAKNVEIQTFSEPTAGTWDVSDSVAFAVVVP